MNAAGTCPTIATLTPAGPTSVVSPPNVAQKAAATRRAYPGSVNLHFAANRGESFLSSAMACASEHSALARGSTS
eukprot:5312094-Pyramimonas_sp.AAC.2